jgi:gluconate 2-dehydrogenase
MRKQILAYNRVSKEVIGALGKQYDVTYFANLNPETNQEFLEKLKNTEGLIGLNLTVGSSLLDRAPHLKIISNVSTGYDNLDTAELTKRNIMATNTPGVLDDTTADAIFGILLAAARRIPELDSFVKTGKWTSPLQEDQYGMNVHHKTLGIIGMGKIGGKIAKRAHHGFDMKILYHNRSRSSEAEKAYDARYCDMHTLLKESDFVCLMTPLTPETEGLIGKQEFRLMKNTTVFVNGSRGKTVNEEALIDALQGGEIRAAALDVFQTEPMNRDNPLLKLANVVTTPHIGSSTIETELEMSQLAAQNMIDGLEGKRPPNLINPEVWERKTDKNGE